MWVPCTACNYPGENSLRVKDAVRRMSHDFCCEPINNASSAHLAESTAQSSRHPERRQRREWANCQPGSLVPRSFGSFLFAVEGIAAAYYRGYQSSVFQATPCDKRGNAYPPPALPCCGELQHFSLTIAYSRSLHEDLPGSPRLVTGCENDSRFLRTHGQRMLPGPPNPPRPPRTTLPFRIILRPIQGVFAARLDQETPRNPRTTSLPAPQLEALARGPDRARQRSRDHPTPSRLPAQVGPGHFPALPGPPAPDPQRPVPPNSAATSC